MPTSCSALPTKKRRSSAENAAAAGGEDRLQAAVAEATATLTPSEAALAKLTAERAEAAAARNQIERALRDGVERRDRLARQLADVEREAGEIAAAHRRAAPIPPKSGMLVEDADRRGRRGRAGGARRRKGRRRALRQNEAALRPPLQEARAELARIETEARTLAKILNAATGDLFPAVLEQIKVERGFETALGAALGEDLDAAARPQRAGALGRAASRCRAIRLCRRGIARLASVVQAPPQLARRLAQIGIVDAADGRAAVKHCWRPASGWSAATARCGAGTA